jgi:1-aminocyclopropane-1-carboxylate deaminase/D-cysteine desulfhydrase-like pyridoxal-dependent ACC family enzyme
VSPVASPAVAAWGCRLIPLFEQYPGLRGKVPHMSFCDLPTPVGKLGAAGQALGVELYVKRDDLSGEVYGGNKPRRLEFELANAHQRGARSVITFGYAGSNHALATAVYAQRAGLGCILVLLEQPNAQYVRDNLAAHSTFGAELYHCPDVKRAYARAIFEIARHTLAERRPPYLIEQGGSSPLGTVGYVNAALELKQQIDQGLLPEPRRIYIPWGSMGSAVGLAIGLKAVGLRSVVVGVDIVGPRWASPAMAARLYKRTNRLLTKADPSFPELRLENGDIVIDYRFLGAGYAHFTEAGMEAIDFLRRHEGLRLDGSYSGKTFAALMADARAGTLGAEPVLYWDTYSSRPLPRLAGDDYSALPGAFHRYFEQPVQALDVVTA